MSQALYDKLLQEKITSQPRVVQAAPQHNWPNILRIINDRSLTTRQQDIWYSVVMDIVLTRERLHYIKPTTTLSASSVATKTQ